MADTTTTESTLGQRARPWTAPAPEPSGPIAQATELKDMVVAYAKQETIDPLVTLRRYMAFGIGGALFIGTGLCFGLLALLRGLQEIEIFNDPAEVDGGYFSWAPYAITAVVGIVLAAIFVHRLIKFVNSQGSSR